MQILLVFYTFAVNGCILLLAIFTDISELGVGNNEHLLDLIRNHNDDYQHYVIMAYVIASA